MMQQLRSLPARIDVQNSMGVGTMNPNNRRLLVTIGLLMMSVLGGVFFLAFTMIDSRVEAPLPAGDVVTTSGSSGIPWVIITLGIIVVFGLVAVFAAGNRGRSKRKRSSDVEAEAMAMLDEMIEQGVVRLVEDDERPDLNDDTYWGEQPDRSGSS